MLTEFLRSVKFYFVAQFVSSEWWVGIFDKHVVNGGGELSSFWGWNETIWGVAMLIVSFGVLITSTVGLSRSFNPYECVNNI